MKYKYLIVIFLSILHPFCITMEKKIVSRQASGDSNASESSPELKPQPPLIPLKLTLTQLRSSIRHYSSYFPGHAYIQSDQIESIKNSRPPTPIYFP